MKRLALFAAAIVALAACPPPPRVGQNVPSGPSVGCPSAKDVYTVSYLQAEPGKPGRTGWVLPLADQRVDSVSGQPEYKPIDAAAATAAGVPPPPASLWILTPGQQPCQAKVGQYYASAFDIAGAWNISYGVELEGCGPPPDGKAGEALALNSQISPGQCRVESPRPIATRMGEMTADKKWLRPDKETAIPPALASVIPQRACQAPGCEKLWDFVEVKVDNISTAWFGGVNWLDVGDAAAPCTWHAESFSGIFIPGEDGKALKVEDGQDHPLELAAVLADGQGPKVLVASGFGEYTTYDLGGGKAVVGRHLTWLVDPPSAYDTEMHLGPRCDEDPVDDQQPGRP